MAMFGIYVRFLECTNLEENMELIRSIPQQEEISSKKGHWVTGTFEILSCRMVSVIGSMAFQLSRCPRHG